MSNNPFGKKVLPKIQPKTPLAHQHYVILQVPVFGFCNLGDVACWWRLRQRSWVLHVDCSQVSCTTHCGVHSFLSIFVVLCTWRNLWIIFSHLWPSSAPSVPCGSWYTSSVLRPSLYNLSSMCISCLCTLFLLWVWLRGFDLAKLVSCLPCLTSCMSRLRALVPEEKCL